MGKLGQGFKNGCTISMVLVVWAFLLYCGSIITEKKHEQDLKKSAAKSKKINIKLEDTFFIPRADKDKIINEQNMIQKKSQQNFIKTR